MVVHGPEVFDCGDVEAFLPRIRPSRVVVAGVMGRTAAEESGIPHECAGEPPAAVLARVAGPAFLLNHAKSTGSAEAFGAIIARRLGSRGLVHVECRDQTVRLWGSGDEDLAKSIAHITGFTLARRTVPDGDPPGQRVIRGCVPGEPVCVNGIVIGTATAPEVTLYLRCGRVVPGSGISPKPHGLEKLGASGQVDLARAWCKSGPIRHRPARPAGPASLPRLGRIVVIDHCGDRLYSLLGEDVTGILAIGDDTTRVCLHTAAHRGVPVLGITDGDEDNLVPGGCAEGSLILRAVRERDDDIGSEIASMVPDAPLSWDEWVRSVIIRLGDRVTVSSPGDD